MVIQNPKQCVRHPKPRWSSIFLLPLSLRSHFSSTSLQCLCMLRVSTVKGFFLSTSVESVTLVVGDFSCYMTYRTSITPFFFLLFPLRQFTLCGPDPLRTRRRIETTGVVYRYPFRGTGGTSCKTLDYVTHTLLSFEVSRPRLFVLTQGNVVKTPVVREMSNTKSTRIHLKGRPST